MATAKLTGITSEEGRCARCNREIGRVYEVLHPDLTTATYGRRCCTKVTGYRNVDKALAVALRAVVIESRWAKIAAAYPHAEGIGVAEVVATDRLWDGEDADGHGRGFSRFGDWRTAMTLIER